MALKSSPEVSALLADWLADWIHNYSTGDGSNPDGFARAIKSSENKTSAALRLSEVGRTGEASASSGTMSYAPAEIWDAHAVGHMHTVKNVRPMFDMLAELKVEKTKLNN